MHGLQTSMKYLNTLLTLFLITSPVTADDYKTSKLYTSVTLLYWCTYKEMPTSKEDILTVTDIDFSSQEITLDYYDWLMSLSYEIEDGELSIINESKVITDGINNSTVITKSSTNCEALKWRH